MQLSTGTARGQGRARDTGHRRSGWCAKLRLTSHGAIKRTFLSGLYTDERDFRIPFAAYFIEEPGFYEIDSYRAGKTLRRGFELKEDGTVEEFQARHARQHLAKREGRDLDAEDRALGLPPLHGTVRQVNWCEDLRRERLVRVEERLTNALTQYDELDTESLVLRDFLRWLKAQDNCQFWIINRAAHDHTIYKNSFLIARSGELLEEAMLDPRDFRNVLDKCERIVSGREGQPVVDPSARARVEVTSSDNPELDGRYEVTRVTCSECGGNGFIERWGSDNLYADADMCDHCLGQRTCGCPACMDEYHEQRMYEP